MFTVQSSFNNKVIFYFYYSISLFDYITLIMFWIKIKKNLLS